MISRSAWPPGVTVSVAPNVLAISIFSAERSTRDDLLRAGDAAALDDGEADPAASDHRRRGARAHRGGLDGRPDAGGDPASDKGGRLEGDILLDGDDADAGYDGLLGHVAEEGHHPHVLPVTVYPGGSVELVAVVGSDRAQIGLVVDAMEALAALGDEGEHHVVAGADRGSPLRPPPRRSPLLRGRGRPGMRSEWSRSGWRGRSDRLRSPSSAPGPRRCVEGRAPRRRQKACRARLPPPPSCVSSPSFGRSAVHAPAHARAAGS